MLDDAEIPRVVTSSWRWLVTTRAGPEGWRRKATITGAVCKRWKTIAALAQDADGKRSTEAAFLNGTRTRKYGLTADLR